VKTEGRRQKQDLVAEASAFNEVSRRLLRLGKIKAQLRPEKIVGNEIDLERLVTRKNDDRRRLQKMKSKRDA
jgi:hypothetical protein